MAFCTKSIVGLCNTFFFFFFTAKIFCLIVMNCSATVLLRIISTDQ